MTAPPGAHRVRYTHPPRNRRNCRVEFTAPDVIAIGGEEETIAEAGNHSRARFADFEASNLKPRSPSL
jgi:hypothetical protein